MLSPAKDDVDRGKDLRRSMRLIKAQSPIDAAKLWDPQVDLRTLAGAADVL